MVSPSAALQSCFDRASAASQPFLRRCLDQTIALLQAAETQTEKQSERTELGDAWRDVVARGSHWCERYPEELRRAFSAALGPKPAQARTPERVGEFTLVGDEQIAESIESSRRLQHVLPLVERPVSELDALVSATLGHASVHPQLNPMRPEIFAQALRAAMGAGPGEGGAHHAWMRYLAEPLGHELQAIYAELVTLLQQAKVHAVGYRVSSPAGTIPASQRAGLHPAGAVAPKQTPPADRAAARAPALRGDLCANEVSRALLRDFLAHGLGPEAAIGQDAAQTEPFFQALMKLHHPVLKLRRARSRQDARESGTAPAPPMDVPGSAEAAPAQAPAGSPWMNARELDAAGFEETLPTDMADLAGETASQPMPLEPSLAPDGAPIERTPAAPLASAEAVLAQLREGDWVDLYSRRKWRRAQLVWASGKGTLFMFVSHGGRPHSMTQRICRRLIEQRYLRRVPTEEVVGKALQSLDGAAPAAAGAEAGGSHGQAPRPRPPAHPQAAAVAG